MQNGIERRLLQIRCPFEWGLLCRLCMKHETLITLLRQGLLAPASLHSNHVYSPLSASSASLRAASFWDATIPMVASQKVT